MWCTEEGTALPMKSTKQTPSGTARVFLLSTEGAIFVFPAEPNARAALACGDSLFEVLADLKRLTAEWPITRLVSLCNGIPGVTPIQKFRIGLPPGNGSGTPSRLWSPSVHNRRPLHQQHLIAREGPRRARKRHLCWHCLPSTRVPPCGRSWQRSAGSRIPFAAVSAHCPKGHRLHSFRRPDGERAYSTGPRRHPTRGSTIMAPVAAAWTFKKGGEAWKVEQMRISPAPKLGGWVGQQLRLLSVSRGQSVITDLEQGSLGVNRRSTGLPAMQRMWFHRQGFSLGYSKPRGSPEAAELFFVGPDARLWAQQRLPATAIEASAGNDQWFVACRNGRVYAFSWEGRPLWNQLIPCARRDHATNEFWGLPVFHPRLHLAAEGGLLAMGAEQQFHRYDSSGERLWSRCSRRWKPRDREPSPLTSPHANTAS